MSSSIGVFTHFRQSTGIRLAQKQDYLPSRLWCTPPFQVCRKQTWQAAAVPPVWEGTLDRGLPQRGGDSPHRPRAQEPAQVLSDGVERTHMALYVCVADLAHAIIAHNDQ